MDELIEVLQSVFARPLITLGGTPVTLWSLIYVVALVVALFVVLLIDPWAVLSAGFWLSFGAMAVILWVTLGRVALPGKLRGWVTVQAAVTLALAPVLLLLISKLP
jgi:competence protein ComEC